MCVCVSVSESALHSSEHVKNFFACFTNEVISRIFRVDSSFRATIVLVSSDSDFRGNRFES